MKNKLSILIYSLANGGAERVASILINELRNRYDITLFLMNDTIFYNIPENIKIVYLEKSTTHESGIKKLLKLPLLAWKYKNMNNSDISLSFMNRPNYINVFSKLLGMKSKVVISERAMPSLQHSKGLQGKVNKLLIQGLYGNADIVTANSFGNSQDLINNFKCKEVITIHNPFDIKNIQQLSLEKVNFRDERFTFITIGRLDSGKNHKLLIDAIKKIDACLYIIGDGELKNYLDEYITINNLQDKVFLMGKQENPYKFLKNSDCFVFSSNYEGFPNVILEALACDLPVISTDCKSGPREILSLEYIEKNLQNDIEIVDYGILTPVENMEKMRETMNMLKDNHNLRINFQKKPKTKLEKFEKNIIVDKFIRTLES